MAQVGAELIVQSPNAGQVLAGGLEARGAVAGFACLARSELSPDQAATTADTARVPEVGGVDLGLLADGDVAVRVRLPLTAGTGRSHWSASTTLYVASQSWHVAL